MLSGKYKPSTISSCELEIILKARFEMVSEKRWYLVHLSELIKRNYNEVDVGIEKNDDDLKAGIDDFGSGDVLDEEVICIICD